MKLCSIRLSFCIGWAANISTLALVFHWLAHFVWKSIGTRLFIALKHLASLLPNPDSFYPISPIFDFDFFRRHWSQLSKSVGVGRDHAASWTCRNLVTRGTVDLPFPKWISACQILKLNPLSRKNAGQRREVIDYEVRCPSNRILKWGHKRDASGSFPSRNSGIRRRKEGNDWKSISECTLSAFFNLDLLAFFLE